MSNRVVLPSVLSCYQVAIVVGDDDLSREFQDGIFTDLSRNPDYADLYFCVIHNSNIDRSRINAYEEDELPVGLVGFPNNDGTVGVINWGYFQGDDMNIDTFNEILEYRKFDNLSEEERLYQSKIIQFESEAQLSILVKDRPAFLTLRIKDCPYNSYFRVDLQFAALKAGHLVHFVDVECNFGFSGNPEEPVITDFCDKFDNLKFPMTFFLNPGGTRYGLSMTGSNIYYKVLPFIRQGFFEYTHDITLNASKTENTWKIVYVDKEGNRVRKERPRPPLPDSNDRRTQRKKQRKLGIEEDTDVFAVEDETFRESEVIQVNLLY
jgi:hypothetical protein